MLIVMQVILITRKIWSIFQTEDNFQLISNSLHMCVGFSIIFTRIFFIVRSFKQVNGVRCFVNQRKFRADDPAAFAIRQRTYANTINITIAMILNCFVQTVIVLFTDLANSESLQLPFYHRRTDVTVVIQKLGVMAVLFSPQFDSFNTLSLEYSFRYTLECYSFCYVVSRFNEEHNGIVNKLSQFHWGVDLRYSKRFAREYKKVRSMVLMIIMQSQKSLNFSCGGLFELTMGSFTSIINKTYTLTTYFWNIKQRT
ncbi:hypothetical protein RP20_CCG018937 [Aedes albopictus]|nr:hypothetical protein RP20_CCG018937 [Aedes albopictus]